jgi:hypothetical protein
MLTEFSRVRQHLMSIGGFRPIEGDLYIPVTRGQIATIEKRIDCRLPKTYRQFATIYGAVALESFVAIDPAGPIPDRYLRKGRVQFTAFFGARSPVYDDFFSILGQLDIMQSVLPKRTVPIADAASSCICLEIDARGKEVAVLADADLVQEVGSRAGQSAKSIERAIRSHLHPLAPSFVDLVLQMRDATRFVGR